MPTFERTIYVVARHRRVFSALVRPHHTEQWYYGLRVRSDYRLGYPFDFELDGEKRVTGKLLKLKPGRRIEYTFGFPRVDELESRVRFDLMTSGSRMTEVRLKHRFFEETETWRAIATWWELALSSLRHYVEIGRGLPIPRL